MTRVKFGLRIPSNPLDGSDQSEFINQILTFLKDSAPLLDSVWISDHFMAGPRFIPKTTSNLESFTTISYLSGVFQSLTFGNIVLCNLFRNPAHLAKMGATLQTLSEGRFILGMGAGHIKDECIAYGYNFPSAKIRVEMLEESIQIIRKMWTEKAASFEGKHYIIKEAYCYPKPKPTPKILIGGGGEKLLLKVVARYADWWNPSYCSPDTYKHKLDVLNQHCKNVGRNIAEIVQTLLRIISIAPTEKEAKNIALKNPLIQFAYEHGKEEDLIIGDPNQVIKQLSEYTELGVSYFILRFADFPKVDGVKLFTEKVIPQL